MAAVRPDPGEDVGGVGAAPAAVDHRLQGLLGLGEPVQPIADRPQRRHGVGIVGVLADRLLGQLQRAAALGLIVLLGQDQG